MIKNTCKWAVATLCLLLALLVLLGGTIIVIDPYFHYHKPIKGLYYELNNERSQNDGIIKHFDYDSMIIGTSMAENFKTSQAEEIFGGHFIKATFAGGAYMEQRDNTQNAIDANPDLKLVIRPLDYAFLLDEPDRVRDDLGKYPMYLYDNNPFNDVNYFFNKEILFEICMPMIEGALSGQPGGITSFDDYANWMDTAEFGADVVLADKKSFSEPTEKLPFVDEIKKQVKDNITENIVELAKANPDVEFYYYFTPYSIAWWGDQNELGAVDRWISAEQYAIELMLDCDNIQLYSFNTDFDMVTDLNNYSDMCHHGDWINTEILSWLHDGEGQLTEDNYRDYISEEREYYLTYDYNSLLN